MARLHTVSDTHTRPQARYVHSNLHKCTHMVICLCGLQSPARACGGTTQKRAFILLQTQMCASGQTLSKTTDLQMYKLHFIIQYKQKQAHTQMAAPVNSHQDASQSDFSTQIYLHPDELIYSVRFMNFTCGVVQRSNVNIHVLL